MDTGLGAYGPAGPRTGIGPIGFTDTMVIAHWDPPRRCVVQHTGRIICGGGVFELAQYRADSEFRWSGQLQLPLAAAGRLVWRVVRRLHRAGWMYRCAV